MLPGAPAAHGRACGRPRAGSGPLPPQLPRSSCWVGCWCAQRMLICVVRGTSRPAHDALPLHAVHCMRRARVHASMCTHACIYVHTRMHLRAHAHASTCTHACICVHTRMHACMRSCSHTLLHAHAPACTRRRGPGRSSTLAPLQQPRHGGGTPPAAAPVAAPAAQAGQGGRASQQRVQKPAAMALARLQAAVSTPHQGMRLWPGLRRTARPSRAWSCAPCGPTPPSLAPPAAAAAATAAALQHSSRAGATAARRRAPPARAAASAARACPLTWCVRCRLCCIAVLCCGARARTQAVPLHASQRTQAQRGLAALPACCVATRSSCWQVRTVVHCRRCGAGPQAPASAHPATGPAALHAVGGGQAGSLHAHPARALTCRANAERQHCNRNACRLLQRAT